MEYFNGLRNSGGFFVITIFISASVDRHLFKVAL